MINKIQKIFGITESGAKGIRRAMIWSALVFLSYMLPMCIVMCLAGERLGLGYELSWIEYSAMIAGSLIVMSIVHIYQYNTTYRETYREAENLRIEIVEKIKELPLSYFSKHDISDLSQSIMKDIQDIEQSISHAIPQLMGFIIYFIIMSALVLAGSIKLGLAIIIPIIVSVLLLILSKKKSISDTTKYYRVLRENSQAIQQTIELQEEIRSYGQDKKVEVDLMDKMDRGEKIHWHSEISLALLLNAATIILKCIVGIVLMLGTKMYIDSEISLLYVVGYMVAAVKIAEGLEGIYEYFGMMFFFDASYKRIKDIKNAEVQKGTVDKIDDFDISLENVSFSYGEKNVVEDVTFKANRNQVTAIVGPSGCGKSTLLKLICRLQDCDEGSIYVGKMDIKNIKANTLYDNVSFVFQDTVLFNGSIMDNIRIGRKNATDEEVLQVAKMANVDEFALNMSDGYNSLIGENGSKLSGGERQRLAIARAMLKNTPIVILDEISSSLDVENEMKVQDGLNKLLENKTVIVVSHRLKSIEKADKIVVMDNGRICDEGRHDELLSRCSLYSNMVDKSKFTEEFTY